MTEQIKEISRKELTFGQAVTIGITVIIVIISNWISTQVAIKEIEVKQRFYEQWSNETRLEIKELRIAMEANQEKILREIKTLH